MPEFRTGTVEVRDLAKRYGTVEAVRGVSFRADPGQIFGLLGRNGAGKTTTLECVLGLRRPDAGSVMVAGVDARAEPSRVRALVGAQLQSAALQDRITPREAVGLFASFYRRATPTDEVLERFALTAKANAAFETLSGGQKQRLFLALAFVHRPGVVVLDEPTAGLDPAARRELHDLLRRAQAEGVTIVLSTHDLAEAEQLCTRIGILDGGRLVACDKPQELLARTHATPRIRFRTAKPLDPAAVHALDGVAGIRAREREYVVETGEINRAIVALVQHLAATHNPPVDLQIQRPTLEDVFIELTGRSWEEERA